MDNSGIDSGIEAYRSFRHSHDTSTPPTGGIYNNSSRSSTGGGGDSNRGSYGSSVNSLWRNVFNSIGSSSQCPTCSGKGYIRKDDPNFTTVIGDRDDEEERIDDDDDVVESIAENDETTENFADEEERNDDVIENVAENDETKENDDNSVADGNKVDMSEEGIKKLARSVPRRVRDELRRQNITQEIFASVAINRTQGYLSDLLRRFTDDRLLLNKSTQRHLVDIVHFLERPLESRRRAYDECISDSRRYDRDSTIARNEYNSASATTGSQRLTVDTQSQPGEVVTITAHAAAVMLNFFSTTRNQLPDDRTVAVISEELELSTDIVRKYFNQLNTQQQSTDRNDKE